MFSTEIFRALDSLEDRLLNLIQLRDQFLKKNPNQLNEFIPMSNDVALETFKAINSLNLALDIIPLQAFYGWFEVDEEAFYRLPYELILSDYQADGTPPLMQRTAYGITDDYRRIYGIYESLTDAIEQLSHFKTEVYIVDSSWNRLPDTTTQSS